MNLLKLGDRIRERREQRQLRQADIARAVGISAQAVSKWERGENAPDIAILVDLAGLLGVSVEWLLGGRSAETDTFPAVVFCTSLKGYADRASHSQPRELAAWANGIHYVVTEALLHHDGVPIKTVGDGLLAFFSGRDAEQRALAAAKEAHDAASEAELVIAMHAGEIYLGTVGHPDYARPDILGQTVNTAFLALPWVAEHCEGGIGLTDAMAESLSNESPNEVGEIHILGRDDAVRIYEPE